MSAGVIAAHYVAGPVGAVTFQQLATGVTVTGVASITLNYTSVKTAGHLVLGLLSLKDDTVTPTDLASPWTPWVTRAGGAGSVAADTGPTRMCVSAKVLTGSEGASESVSLSGGPSPGITQMMRYSGVDSSAIATAVGSDNTTGTTLSVTFDSDPGFQAGDVALWVLSATTDVSTLSAHALSIPGCTLGSHTLRLGGAGTTTGLDGNIWAGEFPVTSGTSSGAGTFTSTAGSVNLGAGPMILVRLRPA